MGSASSRQTGTGVASTDGARNEQPQPQEPSRGGVAECSVAANGRSLRPGNLHHTTTVRNLVNLRKNTLMLVPRPDEEGVFDIQFSVDAVQDFTVSIFLFAKEDRKSGKISAKQVICNSAHGSDGLNIKFPFSGLDPESACLRTADIEAEQLHCADLATQSYPLIIRLETIAEGHEYQSKSLSSRSAGSALVPWVQSQTTCAVVGELQAGFEDESCKVLRQRIWINEQFYDLQEIYGIVEASQGQGVDADQSADCVVCLSNRKNTTVLPCRHFCMCSECAKALLRRTRTCPMCRLPISSVLQIQIQQ